MIDVSVTEDDSFGLPGRRTLHSIFAADTVCILGSSIWFSFQDQDWIPKYISCGLAHEQTHLTLFRLFPPKTKNGSMELVSLRESPCVLLDNLDDMVLKPGWVSLDIDPSGFNPELVSLLERIP